MTYAISETDLMHIATFTAESSRLYSVSGFLFGVLVNVWITYGPIDGKLLSPLADFCLHKGSVFLGVASVGFFLWGYSITRDKNAVIDQIRRECGIEPRKEIATLIYESVRRRVEGWFLPKKQSPESTTHAN